MEGRSELALLAYAKLQLSFAAAAAAVAERVGEGGKRRNRKWWPPGNFICHSRLAYVLQKSKQAKQ